MKLILKIKFSNIFLNDKELRNILPIHMIVGNHDLFNKGTNEINSVRLFSYISDNINVYEKTHTIEISGKKLVLMPWIEK